MCHFNREKNKKSHQTKANITANDPHDYILVYDFGQKDLLYDLVTHHQIKHEIEPKPKIVNINGSLVEHGITKQTSRQHKNNSENHPYSIIGN
jgi:hypothetical protein